MKTQKILIILLVVAVVVAEILFYLPSKEKTETLSIDGQQILIEIADTREERELGLGKRESLEENHGMLFVFDQPAPYGFWMKDTNFPLDIIWIDQGKRIIYIKEDVQPSSFPNVYSPTSPARYVLEVNAGYAKAHQIKVGDELYF